MSEESAVKLKPFSGKEEEWVYSAPMFLARADAKGYRGIVDVLGIYTVILPWRLTWSGWFDSPAR